MTRAKQLRSSKRRMPSTRASQIAVSATNNGSRWVRPASKPPLSEPFHVAVDRQLKSGYADYAEAEHAALEIKRRYPKLQVTVFEKSSRQHTPIEPPVESGNSRKNGVGGTAARRKAVVAGLP